MKKKQAKRDFKGKEIKKQTYKNEDYQRVISFIIVLVIVLIICGALYFVNGKYVTKDSFQNETTTTATVSYDDTIITVSEAFKLSGTYMVMFYDTSDEASSTLYGNLVSSYSGTDTKLYTVDLSSAMNKANYDTKGTENTKPASAKEVLITRPTLIIFKDGKVQNYITDQDQIVKTIKTTK